MQERKLAYFAGVVLSVLASLYIYRFYPFLSDDSLISLRYAKRLIMGEGLTWTDGERVEGYSNLSWVLLTSLLGWFGIDLVTAARILGVLFTLLTGISLIATANVRCKSEHGWIYAAMLFSLCGTTAVWAIGGLEQPLVEASLAWAMVGVLRIISIQSQSVATAINPALCLSVLCLTRPDSPLFVICIVISLLIGWKIKHKPIKWPILVSLAAVPFSIFLAQTIFRKIYYHEWVANTALVKAHPSIHHAFGGLLYTLQAGIYLWPIWISALLCWLHLYKSKQTDALLIFVVPFFAWLFYIILIGGDIFPAYRHFTPLVAIAVLTIAYCGSSIFRNIQYKFKYLVMATIGAMFFITQLFSPDINRARSERWEFECKEFAETLKVGFKDKNPLVAVTAAGCFPYWSEFRSIDMLGLTDHFLPRHPPADFGNGFLAHELGNGEYVFNRNPDIVVYHIGDFSTGLRSGKELAQMPDFLARYTPISFRILPSNTERIAWINRESERIGIRPNDNGIYIPGYLLNSNPLTKIKLNEHEKLVAVVNSSTPASIVIPSKFVPNGDFDLSVEASDATHYEYKYLPTGDVSIEVRADKHDVDIEYIALTTHEK